MSKYFHITKAGSANGFKVIITIGNLYGRHINIALISPHKSR